MLVSFNISSPNNFFDKNIVLNLTCAQLSSCLVRNLTSMQLSQNYKFSLFFLTRRTTSLHFVPRVALYALPAFLAEKMAFTPKRNSYQIDHKAADEVTVANHKTNTKSVYQPRPETLSSFAERTTLHGIRFVFTGSIFMRLLWALILIGSFSYCSYDIFSSVRAFYRRPFQTRILTVTSNNEKLRFPAVTICNVNSVNRRRLKDLLNTANYTEEEIELILEVYAKTIANSKDAFTNKSKELYPELFHRIHGGKVPKHDYIKMFGHRIEDMLLPSPVFDSCFINNMVCGSDNFTAFFSSMYGQCYTFNSGHDDSLVIDATAAGDLNGLKLLLNDERNSYLDNPRIPIVGLRVLVHDQHTFPLMEQFGFTVHPGVRTLCSIKRKKV